MSRDTGRALKWYRASAAQGYKDAEDRLKDPVIQLFCRATEEGDAMSQLSLGDMYSQGQGVGQDYEEALLWYRMAAEQGNAAAMINIVRLYAEGHLGPDDSGEAVKWCRKAAEQGNSAAELRLGRMYEEGRLLPQDFREAVKWYRLAAEQGGTPARFALGRMYEEGHGVKQDYEEAVKWYKLAAEHGDGAAKESGGSGRSSPDPGASFLIVCPGLPAVPCAFTPPLPSRSLLPFSPCTVFSEEIRRIK